MPRYFFHIRDQGELIEDPVGLELPSDAFVRRECRGLVENILAEREWRDILDAGLSFEITDEQNRVTLIVPFVEVLTERSWSRV
jgi:hypothetical protein